MNQATFDFDAPPVADPGETEILVAYLLNHPGFHTAKQLYQALAYNDRKVRILAEEAGGVIISGPSSPGYCHVRHCPVEQVNHITSKSISQARKMIRKAIKSRRIAHSIIR